MKTKNASKLLSWVLAVSMLVGMLPITALATGEGTHTHQQASFAADGNYYTGNCSFTEGARVTSETPDLCPATAEDVTHTHGDCYSVTATEGAWVCERYTYITVTFEDVTHGNATATARLVQVAPNHSEPIPAFTAPDGSAPLGWVDADGNIVDFAALTTSTTVYAKWDVAAAQPEVASVANNDSINE